MTHSEEIQIRLECLRKAVEILGEYNNNSKDILKCANDFYLFVTEGCGNKKPSEHIENMV